MNPEILTSWRVTGNQNGPLSICHGADTISVICRFSDKCSQPFLLPTLQADDASKIARLIAAAPMMAEVIETLILDDRLMNSMSPYQAQLMLCAWRGISKP